MSETISLSWTDLKTNVNSRALKLQWFIKNGSYYIYAFDDNLKFITIMDIEIIGEESEDQTDFETNYKDSTNLSLTDKDLASRNIVRIAAAGKGTSYKSHFFEFQTCKLDSVLCEDWLGSKDVSFTIKFYNSSNIELTTQASIDTDCVKTEITFKPGYDYELISGNVHLITQPTCNTRMWVVGGAPELGNIGVKEFIRNLNLKYIGADESLNTDGRASKFMKKTTTGVPFNTNQMKIIVKCDIPGNKHDIMMSFEYFRS